MKSVLLEQLQFTVTSLTTKCNANNVATAPPTYSALTKRLGVAESGTNKINTKYTFIDKIDTLIYADILCIL